MRTDLDDYPEERDIYADEARLKKEYREEQKAKEKQKEVDKYQAAKEYKDGICACIKGGAIDPDQSIHWCQGYEWVYQYLKPLINEQVNDYIVRRGFTPFCNIESLRSVQIINENK